jgi:CubicO group peptidase (beta-lactamase class C family)
MRSTLRAIVLFMTTVASLAQAQASSPCLQETADTSLKRGGFSTDQVDPYILEQMKRRGIPGLSLAIIQDGKIVKAKGFGFADRDNKTPVTSSTLFQAGSISKSVAALGALRLVEQGKLSLDEDVNDCLKTWKVPESPFTREKKVTLRGLLSHTAGLTVHGFPGYEVNGPIPSLVQILDGSKPANTAAIRVDTTPGTRWRYSGGGYTIMQQMILDATGMTFPQYMQESVLTPFGMTMSTYEQPVPSGRASETASGYYSSDSAVKGRWHIYPEMAAAGLWTTASDLARFAIEVQKTVAGKTTSVISQAMAHQLLTDQRNNDGLGVFLQGQGRTLRFGHGGRDNGFDATLTAYAEIGQGVAIMINLNENTGATDRILEVIAEAYRWPDFPRPGAIKRPLAVLKDARTLAAYQGYYEFSNNNMIRITAKDNKLVGHMRGSFFDDFLPAKDGEFFGIEMPFEFLFEKDARGEITHFTLKSLKDLKTVRTCPRIVPHVGDLVAHPDPDPSRTAHIRTVLEALAKGDNALESVARVTAGAQKDLGEHRSEELAGLERLTYIAEQDIAGRGVTRHDGEVARVLYYKFTTPKGTQHLLIHLTPEGLFTDLDIVGEP